MLEVLGTQYFQPTLEPTLFLVLEIFRGGVDIIIFHSLLSQFKFACPSKSLNTILKLYTRNASNGIFSAVHSCVVFLAGQKPS